MISKEAIRNGLKKGLIKIVDGSLDLGTIGVVAQCAGNEFYFEGSTDEMTADEFLKTVSQEEIVDGLFNTLEGEFKTEFEDEYHLYDLVLSSDKSVNDCQNEL